MSRTWTPDEVTTLRHERQELLLTVDQIAEKHQRSWLAVFNKLRDLDITKFPRVEWNYSEPAEKMENELIRAKLALQEEIFQAKLEAKTTNVPLYKPDWKDILP